MKAFYAEDRNGMIPRRSCLARRRSPIRNNRSQDWAHLPSSGRGGGYLSEALEKT